MGRRAPYFDKGPPRYYGDPQPSDGDSWWDWALLFIFAIFVADCVLAWLTLPRPPN